MLRCAPSSRYSAFTLIELLAVIAVLGILAALLVPAISKVRLRAATAESTANLRNLGSGILLLTQENNGRLPLASRWLDELYPLLRDGEPWPGFEPWETGENLRGTAFFCPIKDFVDEGEPVRSYGYNAFLDGVGETVENFPVVRFDDTSRTVMLGTTRNASSLRSADRNGGTISERAGGNALLAFLDGHVETREMSDIPESGSDPFWTGELP